MNIFISWCSVQIYDFDSGKKLPIIQKEKTNILSFSQQNKYLITWEPLTGKCHFVQNSF